MMMLMVMAAMGEIITITIAITIVITIVITNIAVTWDRDTDKFAACYSLPTTHYQ